MRAVPRVVNASLFKQQLEEDRKASNQLARSFSLSDANLIRSILAQKPSNTKHIAVHTLAGGEGFALTVPKKLAKRAVDRNRIKRLMRESCRQNLLHLDGQLVVLRLRKKLESRARASLESKSGARLKLNYLIRRAQPNDCKIIEGAYQALPAVVKPFLGGAMPFPPNLLLLRHGSFRQTWRP